ncbi:MAG: hypothetical protein R3B09_15080 [Nannocystaceae bacterium]
MQTRKRAPLLTTALTLACAAAGCHGDGGEVGDTSATKGTSDGGTESDSGTGTTDEWPETTAAETETGDSGEPPPPTDVEELCDAGDEAWVKRAVPLIQGRRPEGMREVRLLVAMIEQIDAAGGDGREVVARGLASGDLYLQRWYDFFFEQLRINRIEVKANASCYGDQTGAAASSDLAAFIRDNDASADFGTTFTFADVLESSLRLDDITPAYRADMFARMARPLTGANVTETELEIVRRANYGEIFETAYLGRRVGCLECHNSEESVTYSPDPATNHFWAIPGKFEAAIYGASKGRPEAEIYAAFRWSGFVSDQGGGRAWGMSGACGRFVNGHSGDLLGDAGYLGGDLPSAPQLFDVDPKFRQGLQEIAEMGLVVGGDQSVDPDQALAFLLAANVTNRVWQAMMGYPLTLAHNFPRNAKQEEILQELAELFVAERYSVRELVTAIATHPYFNQASPDVCGSTSAYHLQPVWEPFSITSADPNIRLNSVGDRIQRYSAWVLVDSAARAMWWALPQRLGNDKPMQSYGFLRDLGIFVKDALPGFNGVDFGSMLTWEQQLAAGNNPYFGGECTGPLGGACSSFEWIELMLNDGAMQGLLIRDAVVAIKDRLITEPELYSEAEEDVIEALMGLSLDLKITDADSGQLEAAARRYAGLLLNTPQFMLAGVPSRDQDPAADPKIAVAGTTTGELCQVLAPALLGDAWGWSCGDQGITVTKK